VATVPSVPSVSIRVFAEMMELPPYQLFPRLRDQKYPKDAPAYYKIPFYREALGAIRNYYRQGRKLQVLNDAVVRIRTSATMTERRKGPNIRLIHAFQNSSQARRPLLVQPLQAFSDTLNGITLRYSPNLVAKHGQQELIIMYNYRQAPMPAPLAKTTLELAYLVASGSGLNMTNVSVELIDLAFRRRVYKLKGIRSSTLRKAQHAARVIANLWPQI